MTYIIGFSFSLQHQPNTNIINEALHCSCHSHRTILVNKDQAYATEIVDEAVELAMASGVPGVVMPLNYVQLSANYGYEQQLTVSLRLPGVDQDQHIVIDTGSSSLAFCNQSLIEEAVNISETEYAQCNTYGSVPGQCPGVDPRTPLYDEFYVGQVFQGNVAAYDTNSGQEVVSMDEVFFSILVEEQDYMCYGPLDGIIGVSYEGQNAAYLKPNDILNMWDEYCVSDGSSIGTCNATFVGFLETPLQAMLEQSVDSGKGSVEAFGLYCDCAATFRYRSEKDTIISNLGAFFGGDLALKTIHFTTAGPLRYVSILLV